METETRSIPDLSRFVVAFLWATMKGTSELAKEDEIKKRTLKAKIRDLVIGFAIAEEIDSFRAMENPESFRYHLGDKVKLH